MSNLTSNEWVMDVYEGKKIWAFIGSYAEAGGPGLYSCAYDSATGKLTLTDQISGLQNPTYQDLDPDRKVLYTLEEEIQETGGRRGAAVSYAIDTATGRLSRINREIAVEASICHIQLDRSRSSLYVSSYHKGMLGVSPVLTDGRVGPAAQSISHSGSSLLPVQSQSRIHSVYLAPSNRFAAVCDLGLDKVFLYRVEENRLEEHTHTDIAPGSGPRHFAFHPFLPYGYVINELNATITVLAYDDATGRLNVADTVNTLPEDYHGDNSCADIHISPDGKFLYGSNRGHDSIAVYSIDQSHGRLELLEHVHTGGGHPRNFALSPDGQFLFAANRDSNNIVTFRRDAGTGRLKPTGDELHISKPVCIKFGVFHD